MEQNPTKPIKLLFVFGTRPEAIKLAPIIKEALKSPEKFTPIVALTAQHRSMLDQVMELFEISPNFDLDIMTERQSLCQLTARLVSGLDKVVEKSNPDWVIVQGDTTSAMVGGMVSFYHRVKIAHVEAGLRTYNLFQPYPEEFNRRVIDIVADLYFAPTQASADNLLAEKIEAERVVVTGNTVVDALVDIAQRKTRPSREDISAILDKKGGHVLITAHRRESFGEPFEQLCSAIRCLAEKFPDRDFVYPVHLNPNVQEPVNKILGDLGNVHLLPPLDYLSFVYVLKSAALVLTDSGGVQEEAPTFGVPVLVMRETTERPEGVDAGFACLVGTNPNDIISHAEEILSGKGVVSLEGLPNPYGDGNAASRILESLSSV
ncbi:UDP-N-acetylglucosamine 2-epimerase (non-hydrolyzing) [Akkermansiaceae bacterium]|nr:UDP-N-acetylglucosamine 2-epimerase (non-hydrolyzing) [bacterium]MDC1205953.1 UDP-N-acetylglucosamine 2-epimerase (non-hydrolyzing) [Akkermansiaceae bacterium]